MTRAAGVRSSSWAEAIAAGEAPPAGRVCPACGVNQPAAYFAGGGRCWDCYDGPPAAPRRFIPKRLTRPPPASLPELKPAALAALPEAQRLAYVGLRAGLSIRAIAKANGKSPEAVSRAAKRLRARLAGGG